MLNDGTGAGRIVTAFYQFAGKTENILLGPGYQLQGGLFRPQTGGGETKGFFLGGVYPAAVGGAGGVKVLVNKNRGKVTRLERKKRTVGEPYSQRFSIGSRF